MQTCGDVMIGQLKRLMYEAILHICGANAILTSYFCYHHHLEIISQSIKPIIKRLSYILHDSFISCDPHLLTIYEPGNHNLRRMKVKFLLQN